MRTLNKGVPPPTSKRAPLFSLELVLEQKHYVPVTDIIRMTPFFTAEIRVWKLEHQHRFTCTAFSALTS